MILEQSNSRDIWYILIRSVHSIVIIFFLLFSIFLYFDTLFLWFFFPTWRTKNWFSYIFCFALLHSHMEKRNKWVGNQIVWPSFREKLTHCIECLINLLYTQNIHSDCKFIFIIFQYSCLHPNWNFTVTTNFEYTQQTTGLNQEQEQEQELHGLNSIANQIICESV